MLTISAADLSDPELLDFLQAHLDDLAPTAPPESRHALDVDGLRRAGVRMWVARDEARLVGTVALAPLEVGHEELKSMRTDPVSRGRGVGGALLQHALDDARARGVGQVSLETGSMEFFASARSLYRRAGFVQCRPFGSYVEDPNSTFFTLML
ncbi:GNAT family N-acetyltransferase [Knoellia locipacati]|uniref:GCN5-related N-acetyltransferase n=1 Tax=Knoellia locipacati TaxID=882824 RepID=A0A512T4V9_9MICO|nr:GNAT family N-acetyltransferase [Knoellia locipacati]GEQ15203.1 GCN5-related N-acetyltransferase [Knoellia locipacati]